MAASSILPLVGPASATSSRHFAWLQIVLDTALVTAIVATTGGPRSFFTFLYVLTVMEACVLLARPGAVTVAGVASVLYIGIVLAKTILPLFDVVGPTGAISVRGLLIFRCCGGHLVVDGVAR